MSGNSASPRVPVLSVNDIARHHGLSGGGLLGSKKVLKAVDGVTFSVDAGEVFGVVGESGCGKSTLARMVMALEPPQRGQIRFQGEDVFAARPGRLKRLRRGFQMVFQDPYGSLDPRQSVGRIVGEPLRLETPSPGGRERRRRVADVLEAVGLTEADMSKYPHEFSGGQRQRIAIARALITRPALIVADEPVSALDVSVQAQVLNLILDLRDQYGLAYVLISHNLGVMEAVCNRLAVMYLGRFVETGPTSSLFSAPAHPYTRILLAAMPGLNPGTGRKRRHIPDAMDPPNAGCAFTPRCPYASARCHGERPELRPLSPDAPAHQVACHFAEKVIADGSGQLRSR